MRKFLLAIACAACGAAQSVERLEPVVRADTVAWRKYFIKEGMVEYDFRVVDDKLNGYVILPDGVEADLHWKGVVTRIQGPRTKFGTPIPLVAQPRYFSGDDEGLPERWGKKMAYLKTMAGKEIDLVLVGDSITHFWDDPKKGEPVLKKMQMGRTVVSLGFGGDGTQHTIWRIQNGELDGYKAKTIALMIGVNNGGDTWDDVAAGVKECVRLIREKQPQAKLILQAILPWGEKSGNYHRIKDAKTNEEIRKLADGKSVFWLDFGAKLLNAKGELTRDMADDFVHPTTKGYEIWSRELLPLVGEALVEGDSVVFDERRLLVERFPSKDLVVSDNLEWLKAGKVPGYAVGNVIKWLEIQGVDVAEFKAKYRPVEPSLGLPLMKRPGGKLGFMLDISRDKVPTMDTLKALVDVLAACGFNELQLYTEHTFAFSKHEAAWKGWSPMTAAEIRELDARCWERGIRLVPNQNSFGHLERWFEHEEYHALAAAPEGFSIPHPKVSRGYGCALNPGDEATYRFLSGLYDELLPNFLHAEEVNVGCDEVWDIFAGNARCAARAKEVGVPSVYMDHLLKVYELVKGRGRRMAFWGDMVLRYPELLGRVPKDVDVLQWGYGGCISDPEYACEYEGRCIALQRRGIPFTVCPSTHTFENGRCTFREARGNIRMVSDAGRKYGAEGMLLTEWGDNGHCNPLLASVPAIVYAGLVCRGEPSHEEALAKAIDHALGCNVGKGLVAWGLVDAPLENVDAAGAPAWVDNGLRQLKFNRRMLVLQEGGGRASAADVAEYRKLWLEANRPGGLDASVDKFLRGL